MEKLKKIHYIYLSVILGIFFILASVYSYSKINKTKETEKYFDIYLSNLYNDISEKKIISNSAFLSSIDDSNINFFANLKNASIEKIDQYGAIEKELILYKYSILNADQAKLLSLAQDGKFFINSSKITYLNNNLDNISLDKLKDFKVDDFFSRAVELYLNDN